MSLLDCMGVIADARNTQIQSSTRDIEMTLLPMSEILRIQGNAIETLR